MHSVSYAYVVVFSCPLLMFSSFYFNAFVFIFVVVVVAVVGFSPVSMVWRQSPLCFVHVLCTAASGEGVV